MKMYKDVADLAKDDQTKIKHDQTCMNINI